MGEYKKDWEYIREIGVTILVLILGSIIIWKNFFPNKPRVPYTLVKNSFGKYAIKANFYGDDNAYVGLSPWAYNMHDTIDLHCGVKYLFNDVEELQWTDSLAAVGCLERQTKKYYADQITKKFQDSINKIRLDSTKRSHMYEPLDH